MKKIFLLIVLVTVSLTFYTCIKKSTTPTETNATIQGTPTVSNPALDELVPIADFKTNKSEYEAGETIEFTNISTNANDVRWTLPDGTTSRQNTVSFVTFTNIVATTFYNVTLEANSKSGLKHDYVVKAVKVNPGKGTLTVYSTAYLATNVDITIDNVLMTNKANFNNYLTPNTCNDVGFSNYLLPIGSHTVTYYGFATGGNNIGMKYVTITYGGCTKLNCN